MDFSEEYKDYLREVITILKENIEDLRQKQAFADPEEKEYIAGRLFSYHEVIVSLKLTLKEFGIPEQEIGLDKINV
jgi:hypothetical protein